MKNLLKYQLFFLLIILQVFYFCSREESYTKEKDGITLGLADNNLQLQVINDKIIRVRYYRGVTPPERQSLSVVNREGGNSRWEVSGRRNKIILTTAFLKAEIDRNTGNVIFRDKKGKVLLKETGRELLPVSVLDEDCYTVGQSFELTPGEAIYGLGQHQDSVMNWRGHSVDLQQLNRIVSIPVIVSSGSYGIFWDNYSLTRFRDDPGGMHLWSEVADGIDYYFMSGNNLDEVISGYRRLTGKAPLFGKWGYGFVQSKERYNTQEELIGTLAEFRKREVPLDIIVQDWFYWVPRPWGSHYFDPERYPDPAGMTEAVHKMNAKIMISIWAKFDSASNNYNEFLSKDLLLEPTAILRAPLSRFYDAHSREGQDIYWKQVRDSFYVKGFDAWWLDATEPEMAHAWTKTEVKAMNNQLGTGARYFNSYPLVTTEGVYRGQREETSDKRVFILTRSAFAGQQRNSAVTWSGDVYAGWDVFRKQISAGLNFCFTGIPYWTTDIGAFYVQLSEGCKDDTYRELFTRWYQFGAFCPVFRVHGTSTPREIWNFGEPGTWAYDTQLKFDRLRYRLLPYIYSTAWMVTNEDYTMMRGLAFDFPGDENVLDIDDQYMFGPAIMVNPVTNYMYFPWTGPDPGDPIPPENLVDRNGEKGGLTAEYFRGVEFRELFMTLRDSLMDHQWGNDVIGEGLPSDLYSVRWTGKVIADRSGEYTFITSADDGIHLWVNGEMLVDDWETHPTETHKGTIYLEEGQAYDIKMEYFEFMGGANVKLGWKLPLSGDAEKIPLPDKSRKVYLPEGSGWMDFWTGSAYTGGQEISTPAPIEIMPLFIRQGSIVPMGPFLQFSTEKPADPVELRIYPGADGSFTLYEDENDNYNYEKGVYSTIDLSWDDRKKLLTIGERQGEFPGMLKKRTFNIVIVGENHGTGVGICQEPDATVVYEGEQLELDLN